MKTLASLAGLVRTAMIAIVVAVAPAAAADEVEPSAPSSNDPVTLGRFTTTFAYDAAHKSRAFNVELAAEAIDRKTLAPGKTFSFNAAVGERTAAFGYAKAIVIRDGMIAEGVGGGACQVASTLHAAALLSGLDVVRRAPHSRPSAYIRMGLDATVALGGAGPTIDLVLSNPHPVPVTIRARAARGTLQVWMEAVGVPRPDVTLTSEIVEVTKYPRVVERDRAITDDAVRVKSFGIPGYRVKRTREVRDADGALRRDVRFDVYPPTPEVVRVSPSFDAARLRQPRGGEGEVLEAGAVRPALVQLRPSTLVTIDNHGT